MPQEIPPLGLSFVLSFDQNDTDYPVIGVHWDPRNKQPPAAGTPHPDTDRYPNHLFVEAKATRWDARTLWTYRILPAPIQTAQSSSGTVRGRLVDVLIEEGVAGTLRPPLTGTGILSSEVESLDSLRERRTTKSFAPSGSDAHALPPDEVWYDYQFASIPRRIFSLNPSYVCNGTDQGVTVTHNPVSFPGGSYLRKHRTTVSYSATPPDDTALGIYTVADLDYDGRIVNHHFHGVLNDAISYNQAFTQGTCGWTEAFTFSASSPSASAFAGNWWLVSRQTSPYEASAWRTVTIEFFEPA